jgi:hypothetical protein
MKVKAHNWCGVEVLLETKEKNYYATNLEMTGLAVWFAGESLASYCGTYLQDFRNKTCLELGSGTGICGISLATMLVKKDEGDDGVGEKWLSPEFVLSDGYSMEVLARNVKLNDGLGSVECCELSWNTVDVPALLLEHKRGFQRIIGADLYYNSSQEGVVSDVFVTVQALLSHEKDSTFYLSVTRRSLDIDIVLGIAKTAGFDHELVPDYCWDCFDHNTEGMTDMWRDAIFMFRRSSTR